MINSIDKKKALIDMIPTYPSCRAVTNALPVLKKYLNITAPGYIESEAKHSETPRLVCHHGKISNVLSQIQRHETLARSA